MKERVPDEALVNAVIRQLRRGLRESLTIAGQVGRPVATVNAALSQLQSTCDRCLVLSRPYAGEDRLVVTVVVWEALTRAAQRLGAEQPVVSSRTPFR